MKYTNQTFRQGAKLFFCTTLILAFGAIQIMANPFDDGADHTISTNTSFGDTLYVGSVNPNNTLVITNSATAHATDVIIGEYVDSTNNTLTVGTGSLLLVGDSSTNGLATGGIVVGDTNGNAKISINYASKLQAEHLYVGFGTNDSGSIELAGDGTEINILQDVHVGYAGTTNAIAIEDGATLNVGGTLNVGSTSGSNNTVNVAGTLFVNSTNDILVVEKENDNGIVVKRGGTLQVGGDVDTETLDGLGVEMQSKSTLGLGGELTLAKNTLDSGYNVILDNGLSTNQANWSIDQGTYAQIGKTTSYNTLTLTNGATGSTRIDLRIGTEASARQNVLEIAGTNTAFTAEKNVLVGGAGSYNQLNITDAGEMQIYETLTLGMNASATKNEVNVGSNSVLSVGGDVVVGANGGSNAFNINHGRVSVTNDFILGSKSANNRYAQIGGTNTVAGEFIIGETEAASGKTGHVDDDTIETTGNLAIVGEDATLNLQQNLIVGQEGSGSILAIRDGGTVNVSNDVVIGESVGDNYIYLQRDADTRFNVTGDLVIGKKGGSNRFAVYGGTADIAGNLYLGSTTNQHANKNFIHLETTNAVLNVAHAIHIGASNSINTLNLAKGAIVNAQDLFVGAYEGTSNNVVSVTGEDSLLSVSNTLVIGSNTGSNNTVNVNHGGTLFISTPTNIVIGTTTTNDLNNRLNINAGGTLHSIDWNYPTVSTNVVLNRGSTLELDGIFSGTNQLDGGIELALNGAPGIINWSTTGDDTLYVGYKTDANTLTVQNGGLVIASADLIVGNSDASHNNTITATGATSRVEIGNDLIVGNKDSSGNQMIVLGGGAITVGNDFVLGLKSDHNTALLEGLDGTNSTLNVAGDLTLGKQGDRNTLTLSSNATVTVSGLATIGTDSSNNQLVLAGSNAVFNATSNLLVGAEEAATGNKLTLTEGTANIGHNLILGGDTNGANNAVAISGSNSTLTVGNHLTVGNIGARNSLTITDGATATVTSNAWIGLASANNTIEVSGTNALLTIGNNLYVGSTNETSSGNRLEAYDMAQILVGGDLFLATNATLDIGYDATVDVTGNYEQDEFASLSITLSTNSVATNLVVAGTANFAKDTTISVTGDGTIGDWVDDDGNTNNIGRTIVAAGTLQIDDQEASTALLHSDIAFKTNALLGFTYTVTNNTIFLNNFIKHSWVDAADLDGMLADVATEIEGMTNEFATAMDATFQDGMTGEEINQAMNDYYGEKGSSAPMHNLVNQGIGGIANQLAVRGDNTRARMEAAAEETPTGAAGPHTENQELQGWIAGYGSWADRSADGGFNGYDANLSGFIIGTDLSVSQNILVGVAGGSSSGSMNKDNGASGDTKTTCGSIYASLGTKNWFVDTSFVYGSSSIDQKQGDLFDTTASYNAENIAFYLGGGKEYIGQYLIITPQASLLANYYTQDAYDEKSTSAMARSVDSFDALYVQSSIGCNLGIYMAMGDITIKPELRIHWLHEFNAQDESLPYRLAGGSDLYRMILQAPEEDILKIGVGMAAKMSDHLELRADLDTHQARDYSNYTLLGSLRYQF